MNDRIPDSRLDELEALLEKAAAGQKNFAYGPGSGMVCELRVALAETLRAYRSHAGGETLQSVADWGLATFGPNQDLLRYLDRIDEEAVELRDAVTAGQMEKAAIEAADMIIMLSRLTTWAHVERKMAVNRAREWRLMGDGTGYHVPN